MPATTRKKWQLDTASDNERTSMMQSEAYDKLQAEVFALREKNKDLSSTNATLRRVNTRSKNHKAKMKKVKQETKSLQQKKSKSTEAAAKRLLKENKEYKILLKEKDEELEEKDQQYNILLEEDDEERKDLSDQNLRLKQRVAASSRLDNQLTDETFHEAMSCAFVAIKDCFYTVLRKQGFNISIKLAYWPEDMATYLPNHKDNTKEEKINLCILAVSLFLVEVVNSQMAFGWPHDKLIKAATNCYEKMPGKLFVKLLRTKADRLKPRTEHEDLEARKKIKQWLSLTREILIDNGQDSMDAAQELLLKYVLDESQKMIESWTDLEFDESIRAELSEALEPLLQTVCMLEYQKWQFSFELLPAMDRGEWCSFDPNEMEGMFAEKKGWVKASLFPQLCRLEQNGRENYKRTVICKARVSVTSDLPVMTDATGQDTKMSDSIDDAPETDLTAMADKTLDIERRSETHCQDQDKFVEKDLDEPSLEDPMVDTLRARSVSIERFHTPEERRSESVIPDSYDGDEEETIVQRRWPA